MASKLLPGDQQNFVRLGIAVVDKIKLPLKDLLEHYIKPADLYQKISSCSALLTGKYKLSAEQQKICYLSPPDIPDYGKFDVTLLCKLIQNLCPLIVPTQGWGKKPGFTDVKIGDDIERLRQFRNDMLGHLESTSIPTGLFKSRWKELEDIMKRIYQFTIQQGFNAVNYEKEVADIGVRDFGSEDMEKYKLMLGATLSILKHTQNEDFPAIVIRGDKSAICGETACFEADIDQKSTSTYNWPITWHRVRGNNLEQIDISTEKYKDSTSKHLVIQRVSKEDQGDYQAIISGNSNGQHIKIPSNVLTLKVTGERPVLQQLQVTSGKDGISLHYKHDISQNSPNVHHIAWTKNGAVLIIDHEKYVGGGVKDNSITITSPSVQDSGKYTCIIANAVGAVSQSLTLGVPKATVSAESVCYGNDTHIDSMISSCPPPERAVWEKSHDAVIFKTINVGEPKYFNSTLDPSKPVLKLTTATFDDKLYYRLRIWNSIGECVSNTVLLDVTGDPPNISVGHEININSCSVVLTCNIFLYDRSPPTTGIVWQKDDDVINIPESGGKYAAETTTGQSSLVINSVNESDAGSYLCKASNAVGSTVGNILLGVPEIEIQGPKLIGNGRYTFTALLKSTPTAKRAWWSVKNQKNDDYSPIDIYCEEYKGTSNNLPQPLLCIKQISLQNRFQIEVQNFIGTTAKKIPDERSSYSSEKMHDTKVDGMTAIFNKKGSSIRFNNLRLDLIKEIPDRELNSLKDSLNVMTSMTLSTENVTTKEEFFTFLLKEGIFKERNVILMQYLMRCIKRQDLELKCKEYAMEDKQALCYFEETSTTEDGFTHVKVHVVDDIKQFTDMDALLATVAAIVGCDKSSINVVGLHPDRSFIIIILMKEEFARILRLKGQHGLTNLLKYNVDWIEIKNDVIHIQRHMSISQCLNPTVVSTSSITIPGIRSVYHISCVTADKLGVSDGEHLLQIDSCGQEILKKRIEIGMSPAGGSHTVIEDGELLFIDINHNRVQKITSDGTITTFIQEQWRKICCIHSSRINGNILVGSTDGMMKYDRAGQRIRNFMKGWGHGMYYPIYITENMNGDIWVSEYSTKAVMVTDKSGLHRFHYTGQKSRSIFQPSGVCTDILGHVLVCNCDHFNPSVHLLDQDGQFLCLLLTREHGLRRPMALCVDDKHNLYLGQMNSNRITVYKYLQETEKNTSLMESN